MWLKTRFFVLASFSPQHSSCIDAGSFSIAFIHFPSISMFTSSRISLLLNFIYVSDTNRGNLVVHVLYMTIPSSSASPPPPRRRRRRRRRRWRWWWWWWWWHHHNYEILQQQWNQGSWKTKIHFHSNKMPIQNSGYMNELSSWSSGKIIISNRQTLKY